LGFKSDWGLIGKTGVESGTVIEGFDVIEDGGTSIGVGSEALMIDQFIFESAPEGFDKGVVVAVALAAHRSGLAYYVTDGPNTAQANFYVFNIATGLQIGTLPSPFTGSGTFSAATYIGVPEPSTFALAVLSVTVFAGARWRRAHKTRSAA
jgi:hypothetical protein